MTEANVKAEEGGGFQNEWAAMSTEELFQKSRRAAACGRAELRALTLGGAV